MHRAKAQGWATQNLSEFKAAPPALRSLRMAISGVRSPVDSTGVQKSDLLGGVERREMNGWRLWGAGRRRRFAAEAGGGIRIGLVRQPVQLVPSESCMKVTLEPAHAKPAYAAP